MSVWKWRTQQPRGRFGASALIFTKTPEVLPSRHLYASPVPQRRCQDSGNIPKTLWPYQLPERLSGAPAVCRAQLANPRRWEQTWCDVTPALRSCLFPPVLLCGLWTRWLLGCVQPCLWENYYFDEIPLEFLPSSPEPSCLFSPWGVSLKLKTNLSFILTLRLASVWEDLYNPCFFFFFFGMV